MKEVLVDSSLITAVLQRFLANEARPRVLMGFDGYIDKLVRPRKGQQSDSCYGSVAEFASRLMDMGGTSSDIAVTRLFEKIGGNGPLLAEALAEKLVPCSCIGAMGYPNLSPLYRPLAQKADLYSVAECATSFALEFPDGKIMLGDTDSFLDIHWENIRKILGEETLLSLFQEARLLCFTNWSGLPMAQNLLEGILNDICPRLTKNPDRSIFFDLADPTAKTPEQFAGLFSALERLEPYYHRVIGLNPKECMQLWRQFYGKEAENFSPDMLADLLQDFPADEIVIHDAGCAYAGSRGEDPQRIAGRYLSNPAITVGAGDNFNSGYCLGKLCGLAPAGCAALGNEAAASFVELAKPMGFEELLKAFEERAK